MSNGTFITPVPKEYIGYSDKEKIEKTEQYYRKMADLYQRIDKTKPDYMLRVNDVLQKGATRREVVEILHEKEAQILCHYSQEFYILDFVCMVAELEEAMDSFPVLSGIQSLEEMSLLHQKCVFLLRRFELDWESDEELLYMVKEKQVSYILLAELIRKEWIFRKIYTGGRVFRYLYENELKKEALQFLIWLEKRLPYDENKIVFFTNMLLDAGERRLAYEFLLKHRNPNKDIEILLSSLRDNM